MQQKQSNRIVFAMMTSGALALGAVTGCQKVEEPTTVLTQEQWREVKEHILEEAPNPRYKIGANFNDEIELIGFDVEEPLVAGKPTTFTWYWKALKDINQNWQVFVHFDSTVRPFRQNLDHHPVGGLYQTGRWKEGQIVRDVQKVTVRNDFPGGPAIPHIGFFRGDTRLPIKNDVRTTNDRRVIGPTITVKNDAAAVAAAPSHLVPLVSAEQLEEFDMSLEGKLDEGLWNRVPALKLSPMGSAPALESYVKLFYTDTHLYIGAHLADTHIWSNHRERDAALWNEEVFEIFLAPQGPSGEYVELQINPLGTIFDAHFTQRLGRGEGTRQEQIDRARAWNLAGLETAVYVDGTLNDKDSPDEYWSIEMRLPLASLPGIGEDGPKLGTTWSANFYRFDRPADGVSHAYGWSTAPRSDFHRIEEFGQLRFGGPPRAGASRPELPPEALEQLKRRMGTLQLEAQKAGANQQ